MLSSAFHHDLITENVMYVSLVANITKSQYIFSIFVLQVHYNLKYRAVLSPSKSEYTYIKYIWTFLQWVSVLLAFAGTAVEERIYLLSV